MINYTQITKIASNLLLPEKTIEKDYFIELLLYYISQNKDLKNLVFRGGTCLKKIYFPDYRFSEDLDFLVKEGLMDISKRLLKVIENLNKDFPVEAGEIEGKRVLKDGHLQIFFSYNIVPEIFSGSGKELKVDILEDNFLPPFRKRPIKFSYQDLKKFKADLPAYNLESIMADKVSRLLDVVDEPRDVYDLWKLIAGDLKFQKVREIFQNKHGYFFNVKDLILEIQRQSYSKTIL
ncbi:nucleotidyl transferase AbiEii/AbiGii toxin family protein [Patescibacteria group bacterium]|nr:nucleotidyl transferase AbiEii/AbiGii toxin family protein [Patescibacteria group bacterium]